MNGWQWWVALAGLVIYSVNLGVSLRDHDWPWLGGSLAAVGIYAYVLAALS